MIFMYKPIVKIVIKVKGVIYSNIQTYKNRIQMYTSN